MIAAPPRDYRLAVPGAWFRILLDPTTWDNSVNALVEQQFKGIDNAPHLKQELREMLTGRAASAYASGGTELYLSMMAAEGVPIAAGLVVFYLPAPAGGAHPPLAEVLAALKDGEARMVNLPSGPAVRHLVRQRPHPDDPDAMGIASVVTRLSFRTEVPDAPGHLLLTFSTPVEPLAGALTELFDQIARTVRWVR